MTHPTNFDDLLRAGFEHARDLQKKNMEEIGLGRADNYAVSFEENMIRFTFKGEKIITAPITLIGTWSEPMKQFMWGWDHPMSPPANVDAAKTVRAYANKHEITELREHRLACESDSVWSLAGIAVLLAELKGVYRAPSEKHHVYLGLGELKVTPLK